MSEEIPSENAVESTEATPITGVTPAEAAPVESPPPTARPEPSPDDDPRAALNRLASALTQQRSTHLLLEYLRLRRIARSLS